MVYGYNAIGILEGSDLAKNRRLAYISFSTDQVNVLTVYKERRIIGESWWGIFRPGTFARSKGV
jgi:hypothetical protein